MQNTSTCSQEWEHSPFFCFRDNLLVHHFLCISKKPFWWSGNSHKISDKILKIIFNTIFMFLCAYWLFAYLLWKLSIQAFCPFLSGLFFDTELYELFVYVKYWPLTRNIICKYVPHSVGCHFIFPVVSFSVQVLLS